MRASFVLVPVLAGAVAVACGSTNHTSTTHGSTGTGGSGTSSGSVGGGGSTTSSSSGGPVPLPALDMDGCPGLATVGAHTDVRTPLPAGVTKTYYVSAAGDDTNAGTDPQKPLQSLARVQALLDAGAIAAGTAVLFHAGDVFHGHLVLQAKNTGTKSAPVVLGAFGDGAAPTLVGTQVIPASSFTSDGTRFAAPVTGAPERLFFGADEVFQARFPNAAADEGAAVVRATGGSSTTVVLDPASVNGLPLQGAHAYVRTVSWRRDRVQIDSAVTSSGKLTLTVSKIETEPGSPRPNPTGLSVAAQAGSGVFFEGKLEYLDADGEWAVQGAELYLRPPGGAAIDAQPIEISVPGAVIDAKAVEYLVVQDLHVDRGEGSGVRVDVNGAGPTVQNTAITAPYYAGVVVTGSPSPSLTGNTVTGSRNVGLGVSGGMGGHIADNEIASGGVGQHATYSVGISAINSTGGAVVEHNFIHDVGQAGVEIGGSTGSTVQHNVIVRAPSYFGDAGGIYWNFDGGGNVVAQNVVCETSSNVADAIATSDPQTNGIYLDDDVRPAIVKQNTVIRAGICGLTVVSQGTDVDQPGGPLVPSHTLDDNVFVGNGLHAGQGAEGGQICYQHAKETTGGKNDDTLGQLRSVHGNTFAITERWQRALRLSSYEADHDYGAIDGNLYALPISPGFVFDQSPSTPAQRYSLDAWRMLSGGKDATSAVGAPERMECDLTTIDGADLFTATQAWLGTTDVGGQGLHLPAPGMGKTQAWIENSPAIPTTAGGSYLVEITTTSATPQLFFVNLTGVSLAPGGATTLGSLVSDAAPHRHAFVVTATGGAQLQIVAGAALTVTQIRMRPVTTASCAASLWDRLRVVTNTTDATQTYDVGSGWLDLSGAAVPGTVTVDAFRSVVLQRATLAY